MDLAQRAVNILYMLRDYAPLAVVLALAMLPYELRSANTGEISSLDHPKFDRPLQIHKYLLLATWLSNKVYYLVFYHHVGLSRVWYFQSNEIWAAPCKCSSCPFSVFTKRPSMFVRGLTTSISIDMAYRCLMSFLPSTINTPSFAVCGSFPASERSLRFRPSFFARLMNINTLLWVGLTIYTAAPVLSFVFRSNHSDLADLGVGTNDSSNIAIRVFIGPMLKLVSVVLKMLVPIRYMLFPPMMPARDSMLAVDEMGVKRVKKGWKESGEKRGEWGVWGMVAMVELVCYLMICGFM